MGSGAVEQFDAPRASWPAVIQRNADFGDRLETIDRRLSSNQLEGKSPFAMELIAVCYRNAWQAPASE
ncbi:hypothetical protein BSZ19_14300 [Bradyrhizobium japonicum]|uniref:Uncharacterized protein n=1 Tax=Bradyrhizobium japonicum TaxID=375 RepID=A0A1Y2JR42_BRAJP|nr:hypothetical protein BSZ19_14300 [Bradyrhizobium japonicum]